jgi:hypothetical protein
LTFPLGRFFGQDVAHIAPVSHDLAAARDSETFGRASVGFQLRHNSS